VVSDIRATYFATVGLNEVNMLHLANTQALNYYLVSMIPAFNNFSIFNDTGRVNFTQAFTARLYAFDILNVFDESRLRLTVIITTRHSRS
jgi:hypothetical protein